MKRLTLSCRVSRLASAVAVVTLIGSEAFAQVAPELIEEVLVTGSRIGRSGLETPTPVMVLDTEALKISGNTSLADTLFDLPSTGVPGVSQTTSNFSVFASGISTVDLRNLGTPRTLVLVNGRRHVGGDSENPNVVDLNSIPAAFIERIEVVTGGASAVYGSEAMAGVINIITKSSLEGLTVNMQTGQSAEGDGQDDSISLSGGTSFASERGHMMFHLGYQHLMDINSSDRKLSRFDNRLGNFQAFSSFSPQGSIATSEGFITVADDGSWTKLFNSAEDGFNRAAFRKLQLPLERKDFAFNFNYELTDTMGLFLESSYTRTESSSNLEPTTVGEFSTVRGEDLLLPSDNPFIPQEVLDIYTEAGQSIPESLVFRKRFLELGPRRAEQRRDTTRIALGLEGELGEWTWDTYYQWGQTEREQQSTGSFNTLRFQQALNAEADPDNPGGFRCKDAGARAAGCVPINVFGINSISPEAVRFVAIGAADQSLIEQQVVGLNTTGDLMQLTSAGNVSLAAGVEYREEKLDTDTDPLAAQGLSSSNASSPISGTYDVTEIYVEVDVPLLAGVAGANYLGLNTAYRTADYSTVGSVDQWKVGVEWAPIEDLRFRAVQAKSVRAPNLAELFEPGSETFSSFVDPCLNGGTGKPGNTAENCSSQGVPPDFDPDTVGGSAGGFQSGNPDLEEEVADTTTIGFVYTPSWLERASLTMDYFDIEIDQAIELIDPQVKLDQCYASANFPNDPFCAGIVRNPPALNSTVKRLDFGLENIGALRTSGIDMEIRYGFAALAGDFSISTAVTWTDKWERDILGIVDSDYEEPGFQEWKASGRLTYSSGPWVASWSSRYIGAGVVDNNFSEDVWPDNDNLRAELYHDLNLRYLFEGAISIEFFAGVNNLTDNDPPYIPEPSANADTGTGTAAGVYDVVGRFFYTGVEMGF